MSEDQPSRTEMKISDRLEFVEGFDGGKLGAPSREARLKNVDS